MKTEFFFNIFRRALVFSFMLPMFSHAAVIDIEIQVNTSLEGIVTTNQSGQIVITVTNNGPDSTAGTPGTPGFEIWPINKIVDNMTPQGRPEIQFSIAPSSSLVCQGGLISPAIPQSDYYIFLASLNSHLAVGESVTCVVDYLLELNQGWRQLFITASNGNTQDIDPIPLNNQVSLIFGLAPVQVPTFNWPGLAVIFFAFFFSAWRHFDLRAFRQG